MTTWISTVRILDTHRWRSINGKLDAWSVWYAARQAIHSAVAQLPRGTRIQELKLDLVRVHVAKPAPVETPATS